MSVEGLATRMSRFRGRARLKQEVHLRSARKRVIDILMQWHGRLGLSPASNQAFLEYLEEELQVTPDATPFSGESHWWTQEILSPVLGGSAATAARRTRRELRSGRLCGP